MQFVQIPTKPFIVLSFICLLVSFVLFLKGFMPIKTGLPGNETTTTTLGLVDQNISSIPMYDKLVIVMIDALRADFVLGESSHMTYIRGLVRENETVSLVVQTHPPTVTLPRIKALTTGSIPGFVDVILNFDSHILTEDNLLTRFHEAGRRIVFYGDDTWLSLFPGHFLRSEGTTSFFVTDYVEVDNNVTRHLDMELDRTDWEVMILHYLGLDHIGHMAGPNSPLIKPKLEEMDRIVEKIHKKLSTQAGAGGGESLILVCGDHGMSDQGGHGGASTGEILIPAVFMSTKFRNHKGMAYNLSPSSPIEQIDITPTLSLLFGLPIPQNNLGILIPQLFQDIGVEEKALLYQTNAQQLFKILEQNVLDIEKDASYHVYKKAQQSHHTWLTVHQQTISQTAWKRLGQGLLIQYQEAMSVMQNRVTSSLTKYDLYAMMVGIASLWLVFSVSLLSIGQGDVILSCSITARVSVTILLLTTTVSHLTICTSTWRSDLLCGNSAPLVLLQAYFILLISTLIFISLCGLQRSGLFRKFTSCNHLDTVLVCGTIAHTLSLMSSSFVEEEHQTWYFYTVTFHLAALLGIIFKTVRRTLACSEIKAQSSIPTKERSRTVYDDKETDSIDFGNFNERRVEQDDMYKDFRHNIRYSEVSNAETFHLSQKHNLLSNSEKEPEESLSEPCQTTANFTLPKLWKEHWQSSSAILVIVALSRVVRAWNQTGNKWLNTPDIGDWLVSPENKPVLSGSMVAAIVVTCGLRHRAHSGLIKLLFPVGMLGVYLFRSADGSVVSPWTYAEGNKGTTEALIVYGIIGLVIGEFLWMARTSKSARADLEGVPNSQLWEKLHSASILLMSLLYRPHNVILVSVATIQEHLISRYILHHWDLSIPGITLYYFWMGQAAFFYQGNSNSISTVDVSAGYIGLDQYQPVLIGLLMCLATYAGLLFWMVSLAKALSLKTRYLGGMSVTSLACNTLLLTRLLPLSVYSVLVTVERYHLFVWTVFSPKLLYEGMLSVVIAVWSSIMMLVL